MKTIRDFQGIPRTLSKELYRINRPTNHGKYLPVGRLVRLISGVDDNEEPGFHFLKGWCTVCREATVRRRATAEFLGVPVEALTKVR